MNRSKAELRAAQAAEMAVAGMAYSVIAKRLGFADKSGAWRAVRRCLKARQTNAADLMIEKAASDLAILDDKLWAKAMTGDMQAARLLIRAFETATLLNRDSSTMGSQPSGSKERDSKPRPPAKEPARPKEHLQPGSFVDFVAH